MIRYRLKCDKSHEFEGWFKSGDAFDKQVKRKLLPCPVCGSHKISKALMAPSVVTSERKVRRKPQAAQPVSGTDGPTQTLAVTAEQREVLRRLRKMRDEVLAKSDYVGPRFAEEARKIHNKEADARGIHGEASPADVRSLVEDGIDVFPVPVLPDDHN